MLLIHGLSDHFIVALFGHWLDVMLIIHQKSLVVTAHASFIASFIEIIHVCL
jgi:hypothetical protein